MSAIVNTFNLQLINLATVLSKRFENDFPERAKSDG